MNNKRVLTILSLILILLFVCGNACAQDTAKPAFKVSGVVPDQQVVLITKNFPADMTYIVSMASAATPDDFSDVARFNSGNKGGILNVTVKIPAKFQGLNVIELKMTDENGSFIRGNFTNLAEAAEPEEDAAVITLNNPGSDIEQPAAEEPVAEEKLAAEEPAAEENPAPEVPAPAEEPAAAENPAAEQQPAEINILTCDFSIIPTVSINAVTRNVDVTFTTANFPADSSFSVSMGQYVSTWTPSRQPAPAPRHHEPVIPARPVSIPSGASIGAAYIVLYPISSPDPVTHAPGYAPVDPKPGVPAPQPYGYVTSSFSGVEVGTFETGDGSSQTLTFEIPSSLQNVNPIALWISDLGPCGFYSYNYFYNNSTSW